MIVNPSIFKSYDIRGVFPGEINEETARKVGRAFASFSKAKKIAIGKDGRISSDNLQKELIKGINDKGVDVYDLGTVPTECLYFAVGNYEEITAGIMITASHNPKEYNGFKIVKKEGEGISVLRGKDMLNLVLKENDEISQKKGVTEKKDIWDDYIKHVLSFVNLNNFKKIKVVADTGNGVASEAISRLTSLLPLEIIPLNFNIDGNFTARNPNPLKEGASNIVKKEVLDKKADAGFMFDGDGDRIFLIDEKGFQVGADMVLLLLARHFLENEPNSAISYNVICSKAVPEIIRKWGGVPVRTAVGFVNVREGIIKKKGAMGGELSGHYCFKKNFYLDSGIIAFLIILEIISKSQKKVSEIISEFSLYSKSSEINFEIENKEMVLNKMKEKYKDGRQDYLDGVTVEYDSFWFNIRASQTEPLLRFTIEAENDELLKEKKEEVTSFIKGLSSV